MDCKWHEKEEPIEEGETVGCPECGRMIATKICEACGNEFLDWSWRIWDDIMAGPAATSSGDFCCTYCLPHIEAARERQEDEDAMDYGAYDPMVELGRGR